MCGSFNPATLQYPQQSPVYAVEDQVDMGRAFAGSIAVFCALTRQPAWAPLLVGLLLHLATGLSHGQRFMERLDRDWWP
jgi:hypothetical protein